MKRKIIIEFDGIEGEFNPPADWFIQAVNSRLYNEGMSFIKRIELLRKVNLNVYEEQTK